MYIIVRPVRYLSMVYKQECVCVSLKEGKVVLSKRNKFSSYAKPDFRYARAANIFEFYAQRKKSIIFTAKQWKQMLDKSAK